ncbi:MAG: CUAEP/CCAEP-tail radical SAM (seleno)protein [Thermomicrobiales bacterium]
MRGDGGVLLVSCYELGHQPVSLAGPLAVLRGAGFAPAAVDAAVEPLDDGAIRAARLVAIAVPMHTALRLGVAVAARVRAANPEAHVCFYGLYATLNADHLLGGPGDSVISGEFEGALLGLAEALDRGEDAAAVPGVGTMGRMAAPVLEPLPAALRHLQPDRTGLPPLRSYAGLEWPKGTIVQAGAVEATRGCHHQCRHCPIPPIYGGKFVIVPREVVVADARAQIAAGARHLTFTDPDFFNGPGHGLRIMRDLHDEFPWLTFDATIKVEHLLQHRKRLPELAESGCIFVVTAVESLAAEPLRRMAKGHDRAMVDEALALLDGVGIAMRPSLLPFSPWETLEGYRDLLAWVAENDLTACVDPVMLSIRLLIPPGSLLLDDPERDGWLGELDRANFTWRWRHPDPRMDALHRDVAEVVEAAAALKDPVEVTFGEIWAAAWEVAGEDAPPIPAPVKRRAVAPALTESWFC